MDFKHVESVMQQNKSNGRQANLSLLFNWVKNHFAGLRQSQAVFRISLLGVLILHSSMANAFDKGSAYISLFKQNTKIIQKDTSAITRTTYEIIFNYNDEKAITLAHNYSIYYSYFDKLEDLKVYTRNPDASGKMKTIHIRDFKTSNESGGGVFYDDQTEVEIDFLGLVVGSEAHVEYTITTNEAHFTDPMTFRYYLPIEKVHYELTVPDNVRISLIEKNIPPGFVTHKQTVKRNETIHEWTAENVDEEKRYDNAPSRWYYTPHILYKIEEIDIKGKTRSIAKSPQDLFDWYVSNIKQVNSKPSTKLNVLADSITKGLTSETDKIRAVFNWVKSNIRYVAFENGMEGLVPREAELVASKKYGDCKDMSSLQFALLRALNIPVYLTWIGTRSIPYTYSEVPMKNTDNHMIAAVKDKGEWIFLDATDPNGIYGLPADHIQGKQAMIYLTDHKYELVTVPVVNYRVNLSNETYEMKLKNNDLSIDYNAAFKGMMAGNIANQMHYMTEKDKEEFAKGVVKRVSNNAMLEKHSFPAMQQSDQAGMSLSYGIKDYAREVNREKYVNLFLIKSYLNEEIVDPKRLAPVSFKFNATDQTSFVLHIPSDYKVSFVPPNASFKHENFEFLVEYKLEADKLTCKQEILTNFPDLLLKAESFDQWNKFIKGLNKAYKESVILEKIK